MEIGKTRALVARFVFAASFRGFIIRIGEPHRQPDGPIVESRRTTQSILNRGDDAVLVLPETYYIAMLVEDDEQHHASALCFHLPDQRAGAAIGSHQSPGFCDHAAAL